MVSPTADAEAFFERMWQQQHGGASVQVDQEDAAQAEAALRATFSGALESQADDA
jgi:hypothetical protein